MTKKAITKKQQNDLINGLAAHVTLRNHLEFLVNKPRTTLMTRDEEKQLAKLVTQLDREIVDTSLELITMDESKEPVIPLANKIMKEAKAVQIKEEIDKQKGVFRRVE